MASDGIAISGRAAHLRRPRPVRRAALAAAALFAAAPAAAEPLALDDCMACHGPEALSYDPAVPALGGQPELYTLYQLFFFREGRRQGEPMNSLLEGASDSELQRLATEIAALPAPTPAEGADADLYARGREVAEGAQCGTCHLPDYAGRKQMPRLAGQQEEYLLQALHDYRSGARIGTQAAMPEALHGIAEADFEAIAHYLAHYRG